MARGQSASLDRRKLLADPVMVTTIVLLIAFLAIFILYPLAILLVDSVYSPDTGVTGQFFTGIFGENVVGGALGKDGQLTVMRSFGYGEPYVGRVNLLSGEVAEDFAMYYLESEQTPSICALGTLVGEQILSAGGILIQAMPGCSDELLDALEIRAELFGAISQMLQEMTLEEIVSGCFRGLEPEILEEIPLTLHCDCSREYIERVLLSMGEAEIRDLIRTQNGCEVSCHFCRSHYAFTGEELEKLIEQGLSDSEEG